MADIKVSKQSGDKEQRLQRRGEQGGMTRRGEYFPSLFSLSPREFLASSPFTLMRRIAEDMDRAFSGWMETRGGEQGTLWMPPIEVYERDNKITVRAELPGMNKDDVKVQVSDGNLVIQGERKHEEEQEREGVYHSERSYGQFYRAIPLPEEAKLDDARADYKDGVLEITIPIPESARKARQIPISTGTEARKTQAA